MQQMASHGRWRASQCHLRTHRLSSQSSSGPLWAGTPVAASSCQTHVHVWRRARTFVHQKSVLPVSSSAQQRQLKRTHKQGQVAANNASAQVATQRR